MDHLSPPPSTDSPLNIPAPVSILPSVSTGASSSPSPRLSPAPTLSSYDHSDGHIFVLTDGDGSIYTTTIYSTQSPSEPTSTPVSSVKLANTGSLSAIIAGVGGGVGLLLLLIGLAWFIRVRRAKRRAGRSAITDRKFYPDRYNQTVTSNRHSEYNEIEPGPVVVQPPLPRPPPPKLSHQTSSLSSDPLSRRIPSYQNHIPSSQIRGNWAGVPPDGVLEDIPPLARHRVPYPSSPSQPLVDRYTMLPSRSTSSSNAPTTSFVFAPDPPPYRPHHLRSSPSTHRRHHSHHSYHSRLQHQGHDVGLDSYFPPVSIPMRTARRNTVFVSPPMSPSSFSALSSPPPDLPINRVGPTTATLTSRPSIARSTFSSTDPLDVNDTTTVKRMMCTNPDLDVDLETDTEPDEPGSGGSGGSPSATDIIRLYDSDRDRDTPPASSMREKGPPTTPIIPISVPGKGN